MGWARLPRGVEGGKGLLLLTPWSRPLQSYYALQSPSLVEYLIGLVVMVAGVIVPLALLASRNLPSFRRPR